MKKLKPHPITLDFRDAKKKQRKKRITDLSAILYTGRDLWLASDETTTIERLVPTGPFVFGDYASFALSDYLELPAGDSEEVDIEGLAFEDGHLWITGSHALKRQAPAGRSDEDDIEALANIVRETNRFLLARIPLIGSPVGDAPTQLAGSDGARTASQLIGTSKSNMLVDALRDDEHLGRFLAIPAKENGFDIEGMSVMGDRIFLGLRGPVLRGWAVILELKIEAISPAFFRLLPIGPDGRLYQKHFIDLCGLGVRELSHDGDDLLILAGPTMDLDGHVLVYRWKKVRKQRKQCVVPSGDLDVVLDFQLAKKARDPGKDHPEGMCLFGDGDISPGLLVAYDSPSSSRLGKKSVTADLFALRMK